MYNLLYIFFFLTNHNGKGILANLYSNYLSLQEFSADISDNSDGVSGYYLLLPTIFIAFFINLIFVKFA